jgi:hypothetical protein
MLLETAIGDAYGAGFEYTPLEFLLEFHDMETYRSHPKWGLGPGKYTDDTQMSLAVAECVVRIRNGETLSKLDFAKAFLQVFRRDHRKGYAQGFYSFLCSVKSGEDFLDRIRPDSEKSGGAMRAGPMGLLSDIKQVKYYTELQASVTHDTFLGRQSAVAAALAVHYFHVLKGDKEGLGDFLNKEAPIVETWNWAKNREGRQIKAPGWHSVAAAVTAIHKFNSLAEGLNWIVSQRGDVDTAAAIYMSAASLSPEISNDLPISLHEGLENGLFGKDYLITLDKQLGLTPTKDHNAST